MTLLVPDPCSPIGFDQLQAHLDEPRGVVTLCWFFSVELDAAQVFGADEGMFAGGSDHAVHPHQVLKVAGIRAQIVEDDDGSDVFLDSPNGGSMIIR